MSRLNEQTVVDVRTGSSELNDVMLTLVERFGGEEYPVPARMMSDGSLRFLAILVALLQEPPVVQRDLFTADDPVGQTTLVIEELENGLHASQATTLIGLIREEVAARRARALATADSPALLDALSGEEHRSVVVCERDRDAHSTLTRLVDLPPIPRSPGRGRPREGCPRRPAASRWAAGVRGRRCPTSYFGEQDRERYVR